MHHYCSSRDAFLFFIKKIKFGGKTPIVLNNNEPTTLCIEPVL